MPNLRGYWLALQLAAIAVGIWAGVAVFNAVTR
jgi:hypothetical protein